MPRQTFYIGSCQRQLLGLACLSLILCDCGGGGGSSSPPPPPPPPTITSVTVTAAETTVLTAQTVVFTAKVQGTGSYSSAVTWEVNGIPGGNAQNGTINDGTYVAPTTLPSTDPITVTATSVSDPTKSGSATATVFSIVIAPANPTLSYGQTQQFTATVLGLNNPVIQWSAVLGTINSSGLYSTPSQGTVSAQDTVSASVTGATGSVSTTVNLQPVAPALSSVTSGIVGQTVEVSGQGLINITNVFFSLPGGVPVAAGFTSISPTQIQATVPVGAASGPVFAQYTPCNPGCGSTNSVNFTRLPNLHIRAQNSELSSGEITQFDWSVLGGKTSKVIAWTADQGTISSTGQYQAPAVSAEGFATITACITGTKACDSEMLHLLPFRIIPRAPDINLGGTLQLDAIQGGTLVSPTWSLPAADGSITQGGLFTAPSTTSQAGPIPVNANFGSFSDAASVAVTGGFPGLVNRVWDYVNFNQPGNLGMFVESVAVSGNRAYSLDLGAPFAPDLSYAAIDVYDITNPHQPVWVAAVDATSSLPVHMFTYGNYLVLVDSGFLVPVPSRISIYNIQNQVPALQSVVNLPELAISTVNDGIIYGFGQPAVIGSTTVPVYTFDIRSGSVIQNEYNLPPPSGAAGIVTGFISITGSGNMIYASQSHPDGSDHGKALDAFDISTSPPSLVTWVPSGDAGFELRAVKQLVFADFDVFDFSSANPTIVGSFPIVYVHAVQDNQVLAFGYHFDYLVIDVSNPSAPVEREDVADIASEDPFFSPTATLGANSIFAADGHGGLAILDISVPGGPVNEPAYPFYAADAAQFSQIYDQVLQPPTLFAAGLSVSGSAGGLVTFDASGSTPNPLGQLFYPNETGLAIQVSGTNAYLGLTDSLKVVDVSNTATPTEVASVSLPTNALALSGTTLFVGTSDKRLVVLDVSNPTTPNQIASISIPGPPVTMRVANGLLFVADGPQGLLIFNVSNAASPILLSQLSLSSPVWDVMPSGTTALLAADALGLVIVDISNPAQVRQLSVTPLPPFNPFPASGTIGSSTLAVSLAIQNGLVYVGTAVTPVGADDGAVDALATFDFGTPTSPRLVGFQRQLTFNITVITPSANNLFLADGGLLTEFDNSLPRNSIEIYPPPAALAQSFAAQRARGQSTAYVHSKLNKNWKTSERSGHPLQQVGSPRCPVRSQCSE
jgi:hypothetical protein